MRLILIIVLSYCMYACPHIIHKFVLVTSGNHTLNICMCIIGPMTSPRYLTQDCMGLVLKGNRICNYNGKYHSNFNCPSADYQVYQTDELCYNNHIYMDYFDGVNAHKRLIDFRCPKLKYTPRSCHHQYSRAFPSFLYEGSVPCPGNYECLNVRYCELDNTQTTRCNMNTCLHNNKSINNVSVTVPLNEMCVVQSLLDFKTPRQFFQMLNSTTGTMRNTFSATETLSVCVQSPINYGPRCEEKIVSRRCFLSARDVPSHIQPCAMHRRDCPCVGNDKQCLLLQKCAGLDCIERSVCDCYCDGKQSVLLSCRDRTTDTLLKTCRDDPLDKACDLWDADANACTERKLITPPDCIEINKLRPCRTGGENCYRLRKCFLGWNAKVVGCSYAICDIDSCSDDRVVYLDYNDLRCAGSNEILAISQAVPSTLLPTAVLNGTLQVILASEYANVLPRSVDAIHVTGTIFAATKKTIAIRGKRPSNTTLRCLLGCAPGLQKYTWSCIEDFPPVCIKYIPKFPGLMFNMTSSQWSVNDTGTLLPNDVKLSSGEYSIIMK